MVISSNPEPNNEEFQSLIENTRLTLDLESKNDQEKYLGLSGNKLENVVAEVMADKARNTPFENSIELISGQKFPDIIAKKFYGVEVKTTKKNHWTTTGNSVLESSRIDGIERIFIFFGKLVDPVEFICRPYEDCLSEIVVTHYPRYLINMKLQKENTIFHKLGVPYDELRNSPNPIKPIIDYYRKGRKPGEEVWWLDQEEPKSTGLIIQLWNNLPPEKKRDYKLKAMILFPEVFSDHKNKFNRVAVWLVNSEGIVCRNIRDVFSAGGQGIIEWEGRQYDKIPKIIVELSNSISELWAQLIEIDESLLEFYWETQVENKFDFWIDQVIKNSKRIESIDLANYLKGKFGENHG